MAAWFTSKRKWLATAMVVALTGPLSPAAFAGRLVSPPIGQSGGSLVVSPSVV